MSGNASKYPSKQIGAQSRKSHMISEVCMCTDEKFAAMSAEAVAARWKIPVAEVRAAMCARIARENQSKGLTNV